MIWDRRWLDLWRISPSMWFILNDVHVFLNLRCWSITVGRKLLLERTIFLHRQCITCWCSLSQIVCHSMLQSKLIACLHMRLWISFLCKKKCFLRITSFSGKSVEGLHLYRKSILYTLKSGTYICKVNCKVNCCTSTWLTVVPLQWCIFDWRIPGGIYTIPWTNCKIVIVNWSNT